MRSSGILGLSLLSAFAGAVPLNDLHKREMVHKIDWVYTTVTMETTITLRPGETAPAFIQVGSGPTSTSAPAVPTTSVAPNQLPPPPVQTTSQPAPPPQVEAPAPTQPPAIQYRPEPEVVERQPEPVVVQQQQPAPIVEAPKVEAQPAVQVQETKPQVVQQQQQQVVAQKSAPVVASGGMTGSNGEITFYAVGLGTCEVVNHDGEPIVAVSAAIFSLALCGKSITVTANGKTVTGIIQDKCMGCAKDDVDLSPSLFSQLADFSVGRIHGASWSMSG